MPLVLSPISSFWCDPQFITVLTFLYSYYPLSEADNGLTLNCYGYKEESFWCDQQEQEEGDTTDQDGAEESEGLTEIGETADGSEICNMTSYWTQTFGSHFALLAGTPYFIFICR